MRPQILASQVALAFTGLAILYACSSTDKPKPVTTGTCETGAGKIPDPAACSATQCTGTGACTTIDESKCGPKSTCLPMGDNKGKQVLDFRIRRLNVVAPKALASNFVQNAVVTKNIDLKDICGDSGNGAFNWLLRVDKAQNTILTGGAPPITDPYGAYCFYKHKVGDLQVGPTNGTITFDGDTFHTNSVDKLNIPIFLNGQADNVVILPISYGTITNVKISTDSNCIGGFNPGALDSACNEVDNTTCAKWTAGGALGGYITLEEADGVNVADLNESLCVLVTESSKDPKTGKCQRDASGKIAFQGDYCSTTKAPGGCQDSVWMAATFAASAVKIDDAPTAPECTGAPTPDAGTDSGSDAGAPDGGGADAAVEAAAGG